MSLEAWVFTGVAGFIACAFVFVLIAVLRRGFDPSPASRARQGGSDIGASPLMFGDDAHNGPAHHHHAAAHGGHEAAHTIADHGGGFDSGGDY